MELWDAWDLRATHADSAVAQLASSLSRETMPTMGASHVAYLRTRAEMFAMITLIAAERHRLVHGDFPGRIEDIDRRFLARRFVDPFSKGPLRYKSDGDGGLIVYSTGADRKDDGGEKRDVRKWPANGQDLGFRLRALKNRGRPPRRDTLPEDVFQELPEDEEMD